MKPLRALPYLVAAGLLAAVYVTALRRATGGPLGPALDDAYIHYQYARSFAELHPLRYHAGDAPTTGATSLLYPALVAIGWAAGLRGTDTYPFAIVLAAACLAALMAAARALGDALLGPRAGIVAAAAAVACPSFTFLGFAGMEVALAGATHVAAATAAALWWLQPRAQRTPRRALVVASVAACACLARPEGATAGAAAALALALAPAPLAARLASPAAIAPAFLPSLIARTTTGHFATTGQLVKWMPADPYLSRADLRRFVAGNARKLWSETLCGAETPPRLPRAFGWLVLAAIVMLAVYARRTHGWRGVAAVATLALASVAPLLSASYSTTGNFARYVFTFIPLPAVMLALGAMAAVRLVARDAKRAAVAVGAAAALAMVVHPGMVLRNLTDSAAEVQHQQVRLAAALKELPGDAVVALNDAGAMAYLGERRTYDLIGLTTAGAAAPYVAGEGAVFERLERLAPRDRPTHLAYYPSWFPQLAGSGLAGPALLIVELRGGKWLGSPRAELRLFDPTLLGSGSAPRAIPPSSALADELDVADVESEEAHAFAGRGARHGSAFLHVDRGSGEPLADGGRNLELDTFVLRAVPAVAATLVVRTGSASVPIDLIWNGDPQPLALHAAGSFAEGSVELPARALRARNGVRVRAAAPGTVATYHWWLYQPRPALR